MPAISNSPRRVALNKSDLYRSRGGRRRPTIRTSTGNPNRLLWCYSDPHFTDGTAGTQNLHRAAYEHMLRRVGEKCKKHEVVELHIWEVGDGLDVDRSYQWKQAGIKPYHYTGSHPELDPVLRRIAQATFDQNPDLFGTNGILHAGYIRQYLNREFGCDIQVVKKRLLWGNHGNMLMWDPVVRQMYYDAHGVEFTDAERRQLGEMFGDRTYWTRHREDPPWQWAWMDDAGFDAFATHGQYKDRYNFYGRTGWRTSEWLGNDFRAWTHPAFGHTVIHLVSNIIGDIVSRTRNEQLKYAARNMDLIRPTHVAIGRMLSVKGTRISKRDRRMINEVIYENARDWLNDDFTRDEIGRLDKDWEMDAMDALQAARLVLNTGLIAPGIRRIKKLLKTLAKFDRRGDREDLEVNKLRHFPAFTRGRRVGIQGHTHDPQHVMVHKRGLGPVGVGHFYDLGTIRGRIELAGGSKDTFTRSDTLGNLIIVDPAGPRGKGEFPQVDFMANDRNSIALDRQAN